MTRTTISLLIGPFILATLVITVSGQTLPSRSDTQNWNDVLLTVPVAGPVDFVLQGTLRNGRDLTRPVDERIGIGFAFRVGKYLTVIPNYTHIDMQPFAGRRIYEERLALTTTVKFPLGRFVLSDRNTFERRLRTPAVDATRYRNRLQIDHPIGPKEKRISLFFSDEVFYDWTFNAWVRNRAAVGVSKVVSKHFTLDLYYMRQNDSHSVPGDLHVIGSTWRFKL
jgi:hypothetical protein